MTSNASTSIDLTDLGNSPDPFRRDQYGRYLIVPPSGGKPTGYTRVTTVAKTLDSGGGLAPWKAAMTASGLIMRRGLRARWEALLAQWGDPWYAGEQSKRDCKQLVEECAAIGGANDRKEMGSALHLITALVDVGRTPQHLTDETERDVTAYVNALAAAGVTIVPGAVELVTVLDAWNVAGTADRLAQVPGFDLPLISDLKTGANLEYSWQSIAVQLAAYSRGERLYQQGPAKDGSQDTSHAMPAVNQDWGMIVWLKAGEAEVELFLVDLNEGWEAFERSMWTRGWRNRNPQRPYAAATNASGMTVANVPTSDQDLLSKLEESIAELDGSVARHPAAVDPRNQLPSGEAPAPPKADSQLPPPLTADTIQTPGFSPAAQDLETVHDVRNWLQGRIDVIGAEAQARTALGRAWPQDIPTLRASQAHTPEQLSAIESLLDDIERRYELPFGPPRPNGQTEEQGVGRVLNLFPGSTVTDTGKEPA